MTIEHLSLPANPNLSHIKRQAKDLQRGVRGGDADALARVATFHPAIDDPSATAPEFALRHAQVTVARQYGFESWHQLNTEVGNRMVEERDLHRWFGVQLNNGMWDRIEDESFGPSSPILQREQALYSAYAAAYHWRKVGDEANQARGEHLISRMAIKIGEADLSLRHARRCLEIVGAHRDVMADWDEPFGHEALARALAARGETSDAERHRRIAIELTAAVADEADRAVLEAELSRQPWFGLEGE